MGWFYGFKLHLVINGCGEIVNFVFSKANVDDRDEDIVMGLTKSLQGKLIGDKGYISKSLFTTLHAKGIQLITKIKKNMKNKLMSMLDKLLLYKRGIIETVNDQLKNICLLEHTRHRSPINAMVHWVGAIAAYAFKVKKPSILS